jgi:probable HAF family extracellular repeat protein
MRSQSTFTIPIAARLLMCSSIRGANIEGLRQYAITPLGVLPGANYSYAKGINNWGAVVGFSALQASWEHPFLYYDGDMRDLGTLGGVSGYATAMNDSGQVVRSATDFRGRYHAFLYSEGGLLHDLGTLGGNTSIAYAINASGDVVGQAETISGLPHAFLSTGGGPLQDLGTFPDGNSSSAWSLNNSAQVVGQASIPPGYYHAFLYTGEGALQDLGTLAGVTSWAFGINDSGDIVGFANTVDGRLHTFLYSGKGPMQDLGTLGEANSQARAINNLGQVVGISFNTCEDCPFRIFLYDQGVMQDLSALIPEADGWTLYDVAAINDLGQIAATGLKTGVGMRALLLTPIKTSASEE